MALFGALYIGLFLLFLSHSTLLHFYAEEAKGVPIPASRIVLPLARRGKVSAAFAFAAASVFLLLAVDIHADVPFGWEDMQQSLPMATIFVVLPFAYHAAYIARRLTRALPDVEGRWMFLPRPASRSELLVPGLIAVIVNLLGYLIKHFA
jgi:phosphatidylglycerophosphate synthase